MEYRYREKAFSSNTFSQYTLQPTTVCPHWPSHSGPLRLTLPYAMKLLSFPNLPIGCRLQPIAKSPPSVVVSIPACSFSPLACKEPKTSPAHKPTS
eukprot:9500506-Pyramimonas_sp.AAC.6